MIHPAIITSARLETEKQASISSASRYLPAAVGALGGAYLGSKRPDLSEDELPTRGQKIRGALVGGLAGAGLGHLSDVTGFHRAVGASLASGARAVGRTVAHPIESAKNVVYSAYDPLLAAAKNPRSLAIHAKEELRNPIGALFMGISGYDAYKNMKRTQDPETGRRRGLAERALSTAGSLGSGLAYGAYKGPASANNQLTKFIGGMVGSDLVGRGATAVGRRLDSLSDKTPASESNDGKRT